VKGGIQFSELLPSKDGRDIHTGTQADENDFFKYAVEMVSGAMICIPSFMKISSGMQTSIEGIHRHTDRKEIA
jgi:hypothetical protein